MSELDRRSFLKGTAAAAAGLSIGVTVSCGGARRARMRYAEKTKSLRANVFVTVLASGVARIHMHKAEIGQGVSMAFATLVAEELEIGVEDTEIVFADSLPEYRLSSFGIPMFGIHSTGGSTTASEIYTPLRQAGAAARIMLVKAAARQWGVKASDCTASGGSVHHRATNRSLPYGQLTVAAAKLDVPEKPPLKARKDFRLIGKPGRRPDAAPKVTGAATFGIDHTVPNMVRAMMIHPPELGARVGSVDATQAKTMPGVLDVIEIKSGVAVIADKIWQAKRAAATVKVTWRSGKAARFSDERLMKALREHTESGDIAEERGNARKRGTGETEVKAIYEFPYLAHATLEPQNSIADVRGGKVEVWSPCQNPSIVQNDIGQALGVSSDDVLVHTTFSGGGFGRRIYPEAAVEAARLSKKVKRPVQVVWSRESDMTTGRYRPAGAGQCEGTVKNGTIHRLRVHNLVQPILPAQQSFFRAGLPGYLFDFQKDINVASMIAATHSNTAIDLPALEGVAHQPYRIPHFQAEYTPVRAAVDVAFWRAVGHSHNGFIMESIVDELAVAAGADPVEFRRGMLEADGRERRVLDAVAKLASWGSPAAEGYAKGIARHTSFGTEVAQIVEAGIINGRIRVRKVWAAVDCGIAINPDVVVAQIESGIVFGLSAALDQRITIRDGVPQETNYDTYPVIRMHEAPDIEVVVLDSDAHPSGIGEPGLPPIAPAVASAIYRKHQIRLRSMPMQPALDAMKKETP